MEFTPIFELKKMSGYIDDRSVMRWVQSLGVQLHKVGKNWCVVKEEFESALTIRYANNVNRTVSRRKRTAGNNCEQKFLSELDDLLDGKYEV